MKSIDLRSDTVTKPTEEMRKAMAEAAVGDDVYGDDPTVNRLEALAAKGLGKEAGLLVPSGTFGNQLAILTHTRRGDEVILGRNAHIFVHEAGASAVIAGVQLSFFDDSQGYPETEVIESLIRGEDIHFPRTGLICMENAHSSGRVIPLEKMASIKKMAETRNINVHLDGARIFNAAQALGCDPAVVAEKADSVMFCLSKGLCAPVGSMLVGTNEFIERARKNRKIMGGGMRQAGVIAAPGIIAVEKMSKRLKEDHDNARYLAKRLSEIDKVDVHENKADINMVFCDIQTDDTDRIVNELEKHGIIVNPRESGEWRFVTNYWVSREDIDRFVDKLAGILS